PDDHAVRLWDVETGEVRHLLPGTSSSCAVVFAPDGKTVASACQDGTITVWEVATGRELRTMQAEDDLLRCLAISPDGLCLAAAGRSGTVRLWDPETGQDLLTLEGTKAQINALAFAPDGSTLAAAGHDGSVRLWRARDG